MRTSIIICTYNEESTIQNVVKSCCSHNTTGEVIVVDDGSTDNTEAVLNQISGTYNFAYYKMKKNYGKSWCMAYGVEQAKHEVILFFDADVSNIYPIHFSQILQPIIQNKADMVLGQPSGTLIDYRINPFKSLTGERAMLRKDLLPILDDIRDIRFGVETYINLYYQAKGKRIQYVLLDGLTHPTKYAKTTPVKATKEFISEGQEIATTLMNNTDLIVKRLMLHFDKTTGYAKSTAKKVNKEINTQVVELRKTITEFIS